MSSQDEARAARMQKYKEERRKQLTARTAALFSANVTDRRRRNASQTKSDVAGFSVKSLSELNLNTASTSVPVRPIPRPTQTSRLRAAAAAAQQESTLRKSRSSSQSAEDDKARKTKNSKIIDRDKPKPTNKRQTYEKENLKSASTTCLPAKEIGAIKSKSKHSINKNILEKDKTSFLAARNVGEKSSKVEENKGRLSNNEPILAEEAKPLLVNGELSSFEQVLGDINLSDNLEGKFDDLYKDLVEDDNNIQIINIIKDDDGPGEVKLNGLKDVGENVVVKECNVVPIEVKSNGVGGLLGAVCVRKVGSFSDLLSNLCSPREEIGCFEFSNLCSPGEADVLFEEILMENGSEGSEELRKTAPECTAPCRRAQPSSKITSTPKKNQPTTADGGESF